MIFIFGYHPVTRTEGPVEEIECPNCHNTRHWILTKMTYFVSLFFIPLIPTRKEHFKQCPICHFKKEVTREEFTHASDLAHLNREAVENDMSEAEYESKLKNIRP